MLVRKWTAGRAIRALIAVAAVAGLGVQGTAAPTSAARLPVEAGCPILPPPPLRLCPYPNVAPPGVA